MSIRTARQLREQFLKYFETRAHEVRASAPIVPRGDPTLLFNSAGMVPFKPYFLGIKTGLPRAASCQKCFRTTDIDRVGATIRHLTFFEMLGNFSFGDYFKADTIHWAWEFLVKEMGLDAKRLHPTVFKDDDEAFTLWKKENAPNPTIRLGEDTNFWNMGPTGPCGPCSEIYYDLGPSLSCGKPDCGPGCDCDRYIEIWNLVFTQFDRQADGSLKPLPKKNIDTGMGLERLALAVQGKKSPFETDLFWAIMEKASNLIGKLPGMTPETKTAFRIIGDHTRAAVVLASEGIIPSNVEHGYVLRRLIRRAVRYGKLMGRSEPFLHLLVPSVLEILGPVYPEIVKAKKQIEELLHDEEKRFLETLIPGEVELNKLFAQFEGKRFLGEKAFWLYETYGFPFEMTREICEERGTPVDEEGFKRAAERAAEIARAGWKGSSEVDLRFFDTGKLPATKFLGYDHLEAEATILEISKTWVILDKTPFYAEGGGQIGDAGQFWNQNRSHVVAEVVDTHQLGKHFFHYVKTTEGLSKGATVIASVDAERRRRIMYHHTATHLLNAALRQVLGAGVRQAGSLVAQDRLRFDFTYSRPMTPQEIAQVETSVNGAIKSDYSVNPEERPAAEVEKLGAVTLLGEDYGDKPRFVLIGPKGWKAPNDRYSLELCGGTHVRHTGEISQFKIVKESSAAAGIRRIEAIAGPALAEHESASEQNARKTLKEAIQRFIQISSEIQNYTGKPYRNLPTKIANYEKSPIADVQKSIESLKEIEKSLKSELASLKQNAAAKQADVGKSITQIGPYKFCAQKIKDADPAALRSIADNLKRELGSGVVFLGSSAGGKLSFVLAVTKDLSGKGLDAAAIAREAAAAIGGSAGGRPDFAQGGGPDDAWEDMVKRVSGSLAAVRK